MTPRTLLDRSTWTALAGSPGPALIGLWADTVQVHALLAGPRLVSVAVEAGCYPALSTVRPNAAPFERLVRDLWGHRADGGDQRPWLDHGVWPVSHPMAARSEPAARWVREPREVTAGQQITRLGPLRGAALLHEPSMLEATGVADTVERLEPVLGFAHKGTMLLMRGKSPRAAGRLAARLRGDATVAHSIAFARAAEDASGVTTTPRATALRDLMSGLESLSVNLGEAGRLCAAVGCSHRYGQQRDAVLRASAAAFGHRLMFDCVAPGGTTADLAASGISAISDCLSPPAPPPPALFAKLGPTGAAFQERWAGARAGAARLRTALGALPTGPVTAPLPPASGEGLGCAESAHGLIWHWLRLDGGVIANAFAIDPAWQAWSALGAFVGDIAALPAAEAALAASASGADL